MLDYRTFRRFWSRVRKTPTCWLWTQKPLAGGYGYFRLRDGKQWRVHRLSYTFRYGPIPAGLNVLHRCDVRLCVRPSHLFVGTHADNVADRVAKGRSAPVRVGGQHPSALLTEEAVAVILAAPRSYGMGVRLARRFGVSPSCVYTIRAGRGWLHLHR